MRVDTRNTLTIPLLQSALNFDCKFTNARFRTIIINRPFTRCVIKHGSTVFNKASFSI